MRNGIFTLPWFIRLYFELKDIDGILNIYSVFSNISFLMNHRSSSLYGMWQFGLKARFNLQGFNWNDQWRLNEACSEWWSDGVAPVFLQTDAQQEARSYLSEEMLAGEYRLQ